MWSIFLSAGKVAAPYLLGAAVLLGAWWAVNDAAYNRGFEARDKQAAAIIGKQKAATDADAEAHKRMTPDQLDDELKKLCRERGGTEEQCR